MVFLTLRPIPSSGNQALLAITNWLNWFLNSSQFFPGVKKTKWGEQIISSWLVEEKNIMESILKDLKLESLIPKCASEEIEPANVAHRAECVDIINYS